MRCSMHIIIIINQWLYLNFFPSHFRSPLNWKFIFWAKFDIFMPAKWSSYRVSLNHRSLCTSIIVYFILSTQKLMSMTFAPMVTQISSDTMILHIWYQNGGQPGGQTPTLFPGSLLFLPPLAPVGRKRRDPGNKVGQPLGRIMFPWQSLQNKNEPPGIQKLITLPSSGSMEGRVGKQKPCMASKWPVHHLKGCVE